MSATPSSRERLEAAIRAAIVRVDKEIGRYRAAESTHRVGGITKTGAVLQEIMNAALAWLAEREGRDVAQLIRELGGSSTVMGAGTLAAALRNASRLRGASSSMVRALCRDVGQPRSAVKEFLRLRNPSAHENIPEPRPEVALPVFERLAQLLKTYEREVRALAR